MPKPVALMILPLAACAMAAAAHAQAPPVDESRWRLGAAFGYGQRSNPLIQSEDIPIIVDLEIAWFGDRWFFDNGDAGLTITDNNALTASLVGRINSDRVFFGRTDTRFVVVDAFDAPLEAPTQFRPPDRDYAVELGVEVLTDGRWGDLQLSAFHDVSGTHEGYELYANYTFPWRRQRWYVEPAIGASYKSDALNNYYWGVTAAEAGNIVLPYTAAAGVNWHARLFVGYQVNRHWAFSLAAEYERLNEEAARSPIVKEHDVTGFFTGMSWRF